MFCQEVLFFREKHKMISLDYIEKIIVTACDFIAGSTYM